MSKTARICLHLRNNGLMYGGGAITGILAWLFGTSSIPTLILEYGSGIGYGPLGVILLAAVFQGRSWYLNQPLDLLTRSVSTWSVRGSARTVSFMSGMCSVAFACWLVTGNLNALGFALYGLLFIIAFSYFYWAINSRLQASIE